MFNGRKKRLRKELPCCFWSSEECCLCLKAFAELSQGKLSGSALCFQLTLVKQSKFMCFCMRLLKVSHSPVTTRAPSNAGPSQ